MAFQLSLYRAAEGLGPPIAWEREHREPLGTRDEVQAALGHVFPQLRWEESDGALFGSCSPEGEDGVCEIMLFGAPSDVLLDISVCSLPPAIRAIMSGLGLNYCHAEESGQLCFPFKAGDRWPVTAH